MHSVIWVQVRVNQVYASLKRGNGLKFMLTIVLFALDTEVITRSFYYRFSSVYVLGVI